MMVARKNAKAVLVTKSQTFFWIGSWLRCSGLPLDVLAFREVIHM